MVGFLAARLARRRLSSLVHRSAGAPTYNREIASCDNVIMHLGVGGFHRSHQAHYLHELLEAGRAPGWGICGVGLLPADAAMAAALRDQDYMYTVLTQGPNGSSPCVVGSIMDFALASEGARRVVARLAKPEVKIASLTITEKGYGLAVDGHLDLASDRLRAELPAGAAPTSALGVLTAAMLERRRAKMAAKGGKDTGWVEQLGF